MLWPLYYMFKLIEIDESAVKFTGTSLSFVTDIFCTSYWQSCLFHEKNDGR